MSTITTTTPQYGIVITEGLGENQARVYIPNKANADGMERFDIPFWVLPHLYAVERATGAIDSSIANYGLYLKYYKEAYDPQVIQNWLRGWQGQTVLGSLEELAQELHEAGREAVLTGKTVAAEKSGETLKTFIEWDDCSEKVKEGRRIQAKYLLAKYNILYRSNGDSSDPSGFVYPQNAESESEAPTAE
jgi:hypothetical protein